MQNSVNLMGRLTRDPECSVFGPERKTMCNFSLACDRDRKDKDGNYPVDFFNCTAFGQTAEFILKYFQKGSLMGVTGRLQQSTWKGDDGKTKSSVKIIIDHAYFGGGKREGQSSPQSPQNYPAGEFVPIEADDEQLPF